MNRVLVCVTRQTSCERLITTGAKFVADQGGELSVVHITSQGDSFLGGKSDGEALEYLYAIAKQYNADMTVVRAKNVLQSLLRTVRNKRITHMILGVSTIPTSGMIEHLDKQLAEQLPDVQIISVPS